MDEITRFRWQLIADETIDRAFAEAGIDELLAQDLDQLQLAADFPRHHTTPPGPMAAEAGGSGPDAQCSDPPCC